MTMWLQLFGVLATAYITHKIIHFKRIARNLGNTPGYRILLNANSIHGTFHPKIPGISQGGNYAFRDKHSVYASTGCDVVAHISVFPTRGELNVADAPTIKEITTYRSRFPKPLEVYDALAFFGSNVVTTEGDEWKKMRKICAPGFSEKNNRLVWEETILSMNDIFENAWENREQVVVDHFLDITLTLALSVISAAGFGRRMTWKGDGVVPSGHRMDFKDSLYTVTTYMLQRLAFPNWIMPFTKFTRHIDLGFKEFKSFMVEMIESRKNSEKMERSDLFSSLIEANAIDGGISADELLGNVYIFLLAGHETTAHTLCFTFALLALYQDEQEKLYHHIKSIVKDLRTPTYEEMQLLTRPLAVFYETLRMFPSAPIVPKRSAEDTTFTVVNTQGETVTIPVPKGTNINLDIPGLHYNPKYWEDPLSFKPDRFLKPNWNRDAFVPFSAGPRACLGRRFSEMEGVAAITKLVSQYKITVREDPQFAHETFEQRKERVLKTTSLITLTPVKVPLTLTRRT